MRRRNWKRTSQGGSYKGKQYARGPSMSAQPLFEGAAFAENHKIPFEGRFHAKERPNEALFALVKGDVDGSKRCLGVSSQSRISAACLASPWQA